MSNREFPPPIPEGALRLKCPHCGGDVGAWVIGVGGGGGGSPAGNAGSGFWSANSTMPAVTRLQHPERWDIPPPDFTVTKLTWWQRFLWWFDRILASPAGSKSHHATREG
jgi:hypothetical protein